ncbi:MAG: hypothetical protein JNK12_04205 [Acidimicrobiales bacterium]|nr:hypothetical protein [Acidimicrobiales bacterium]
MHTSLKAAAGTLFLAVLLLVAGGVAGASTAQFPPATTVPGFPTPTTLAPGAVPTTGVLVPDTTPTTAASTATTGPGTVTSLEEPVESDADPAASKTVWMAIGGLGVVAFLILVLTIVYARHTRPDRWHGGQDEWDVPDSPDDLFAPTAARSVFDHKDDEQGFWWAED